MTQLLVSVRNLDEARIARTAGADLLDVKEPQRGSLGAADARQLRAILEEMADRVPISAALGELLAAPPEADFAHLQGLALAKFGLANCAELPNWTSRWQAQAARFPAGVSPVAVVYADASAKAPPPGEIVAAAATIHAPVVLVDTFDKASGPLLSHWRLADVEQMIVSVRQRGMKIALAGSLNAGSIRQVLSLKPDYIAVRGAACRDGRNGSLDETRIERLAALVRRPRGQVAVTTA